MKSLEYSTENLTAYYENDNRVIWIVYKGVVTPAVTGDAYHWLATVVAPALAGTNPACIFDFRAVTEFQSGNIMAASKEAKNLSQNNNVSNVPTALLVDNAVQEGMVRVTMKLNPNQHRIRIVASENEAMTFFKEWREKQQNQATNPPAASEAQPNNP